MSSIPEPDALPPTGDPDQLREWVARNCRHTPAEIRTIAKRYVDMTPEAFIASTRVGPAEAIEVLSMVQDISRRVLAQTTPAGAR
jgi:methylphosphotriester-DNA--protein-cysteine methyltransferase